MGQSFARLGSRVTIAGRAPRLLPKEEPEASAVLERAFAREGLDVRAGATVTRLRREGGEIVATLHRDGAECEVRGAALLVAAGRRIDVASLGLDAAGVAVGPDGVVVDEHARTANPAIFACGDVIGQLRFTHAAGYQAATAVRNALLPFQTALDYRALPWATFTSPRSAASARPRRRRGDSTTTSPSPASPTATTTAPWPRARRARTAS